MPEKHFNIFEINSLPCVYPFIFFLNYFYCSFYSRAFEKMFQQCLELPSQSRHSICFPLLCTHFMSCTHELCPEEVNTDAYCLALT